MVRDYELAGAEKTLADVHADNVFSLCDGSQVNSLKELYVALQKMDETTFTHHVNEERHDFSNWVKDVHRDYKLANSLGDVKDQRSAANIVGNRIYELQKTIEQRKSMALKETEVAAARLEKILTEAAKAKSDTRSPEEDSIEESESSEVLVSDLESGETEVVKEDIKSPLPKKPKIKNEPFRLRKNEPDLSADERSLKELFAESSVDSVVEVPDPDAGDKHDAPSAEELLEESASEPEENEDVPLIEHADPAQELIDFAEEPRFHKRLAKDMSTVFSKEGLKTFKEDMKSIFHSGAEAEHSFLKKKMATAGKPEGEEEEEVEEAPTPAAVPEDKTSRPGQEVSGDDKKQEMLSHLKRVFK